MPMQRPRVFGIEVGPGVIFADKFHMVTIPPLEPVSSYHPTFFHFLFYFCFFDILFNNFCDFFLFLFKKKKKSIYLLVPDK